MLFETLQLPGQRCVALLGAGGKTTLKGLLEQECARLGEDCTFYEAGDSGGNCLLLYAPGAIPLRPGTDCAVVMAGLGALDYPIGEVCTGYAGRREFAADPERPCDGHDLLWVIRETLRATGLPKEQLRVLLSQADTGLLHVRASDLLRALQDEGYAAAALSLLA